MAIKIGGTTVINDSRQLQNVASIDSNTVTALNNAGVGGSNVGTKVTWTSATAYSSVTFTGLSGATYIEVLYTGLGGGNGKEPIIQLGTSSGFKTTDYKDISGWVQFYGNSYSTNDGFVWKGLSGGSSGIMRLVKDNDNIWHEMHGQNYNGNPGFGGGAVDLGGAITQLKYMRRQNDYGSGEEMNSGASPTSSKNPTLSIRWS